MADERSLSPEETVRWTHIGTLCALAMLLGYVESFIPLPIPGVKLGLANIPVLVALGMGDTSGAFFISLIKVLATGLLFGNPVTLAYSLTGTLLAFCTMAPLSQLPTMRLEMVSVVGALAHEAGQLMVAQVILGTSLVWYGAPLLAVAGCATGLLCGVIAQRTLRLLGQTKPSTQAPHLDIPERHTGIAAPFRTRERALLVGYLVLVIVALHTTSLSGTALCMAIALGACCFAHIRPIEMGAALVPTLPIALVTFVAQVASNQQGAIVWKLGPCVITHDALVMAGALLGRLACITLASIALVRLIDRQAGINALYGVAHRLNALGIPTAGPALATEVALGVVAELATQLTTSFEPREIWTRRFWTERLPQLIASLYHHTGPSGA